VRIFGAEAAAFVLDSRSDMGVATIYVYSEVTLDLKKLSTTKMGVLFSVCEENA
jgi:hypothetical protein